MKRLAMLMLLCACGNGDVLKDPNEPNPLAEAQDCVTNGLAIHVMPGTYRACDAIAADIARERASLEATVTGPIDVSGWTIGVTASAEASPGEYYFSGAVSYGSKTIILGAPIISGATGHSLFHIFLGQEQTAHADASWCGALVPWELTTRAQDERSFLGCP